MGLSDLKPCEWTKNILFQVTGTWEEMFLGFCERDRLTKFQFQKFHCAYEVRNLKESVTVWRDILHKDGIESGKCRLQHLSDLRLTIVIVDFDSAISFQTVFGSRKKFRHLKRERTDHRFRLVAIAFVDGEGMLFDLCVESKSKKAEEKLLADMDVHGSKSLLAADERTSMHTNAWYAEVGELGMHFRKIVRQVATLVVKDKSDNVEARWNDRRIETPRFIHKYAQFPRVAHYDKKLAGRYPRRRVARAFASAKTLVPQTARIVANGGCECNGVDAKFPSPEFFRRAA